MTSKWQFRYQLYSALQAAAPAIYAEARQAAVDLGISPTYSGQIGLTGAISANHGFLRRGVEEAMHNAARTVISSAVLDEAIREVVKQVYGDAYDAALVNTCEAGLMLSYNTLCMPPQMGPGEGYRGRSIALYERFIHHHGAFGRPFPPHYKDIIADQGETAGELGLQGKRAANLDTIFVKMAGADYTAHGIKYYPCPDLLHTDAAATLARLHKIAERHAFELVGITSLGYDMPGYGYGEKDADGTPILQKGIAALAADYDIPYIIDNAWGAPVIGADIRKLGGDVMIYSMDKVTGSPTCGLIIGREEPMVHIRRAIGIHGTRPGALLSHGKAAYVALDPGKEALTGALAALRLLQSDPEVPIRAFERLHELVLEAFDTLPARLKDGWLITPSYNALAVALNYSDTWRRGEPFGIPIFSVEDMYAGTSLIQSCVAQMGILPTIAFDGDIMVSNGLGNLDEDGNLLEIPTRLALRGLFKSIEIISRHAGLLD